MLRGMAVAEGWSKRVAEWRTSGLTAKEFCAKHDIRHRERFCAGLHDDSTLWPPPELRLQRCVFVSPLLDDGAVFAPSADLRVSAPKIDSNVGPSVASSDVDPRAAARESHGHYGGPGDSAHRFSLRTKSLRRSASPA